VTRGAIKATEDAPKLRKEIMAALDRIANLAHARLHLAAFGRVQAKADAPCPFLSWAVAISTVGLETWETPQIVAREQGCGCRRVDHEGMQHVLRLTAIVRIGSCHYHSQGHGAGVTR
jgi:hypothetical protein